MHCSHVTQVHMSRFVAIWSACPSVALRTIVLGAKSVLYLATGQTVVHLPHSTQSNAPVSSMSWSTFSLSLDGSYGTFGSAGMGLGPSPRTCSVNSFIVAANFCPSDADIHSSRILSWPMPTMSRSSLVTAIRFSASTLPDM